MKEIGKGGVMEQVRLHLGKKPDLLLFRNQAGKVNMEPDPDKPPRWVKYGLCDGASDLVGCLNVAPKSELNPMGRFFALETKGSRGQKREEQWMFIQLLRRFGGYADFCSSVEEAEKHYLAAGGRYPGDGNKAP